MFLTNITNIKKQSDTVCFTLPKNVANLDHLITFIQSYGANYSPSNTSITLANLQIASTNGQTALTNVKNEFNSWKNATNSREIAFEPLKGLAPIAIKYFNSDWG